MIISALQSSNTVFDGFLFIIHIHTCRLYYKAEMVHISFCIRGAEVSIILYHFILDWSAVAF